jgi:mono/diheme cytochrome c family protein
MKISCPICDTSIEVSKFLVGQKGRCPRCSSKFLIPESEDGEIDLLERGEIPKDEPAPAPEPQAAPAAPEKSKSEEQPVASPPKVSTRPAAGKRRVMPATGGGTAPRTAARPVVIKQSSGAFGFFFAIILAALVGAVVYVMMERQKINTANAANKAKEPKVVKVVQQPRRAPQPVAPVEEPDEPEPEGIPVFAKVIQPVLEAKCVACHGEEKRKGRLAMHTFEALAAGSGNGPILEADADDASRIEMIFRTELPEADEEHMPPQGKPQLTPEELAIIKWWVKEGAHEDIESTEAPEDIREKIEGLAKL